MKKILTLLILFALVSVFAFAENDPLSKTADGTAAIVIKMTVSEIRPLIQLSYSGDLLNETTDGIDVGFSIKDGGKVSFQALLMNPARSSETFSITFGGGIFNDVVRRGSVGTRSPKSIRTEAGDASGVDGIQSITLADNPAEDGGADNKSVLVTFDGKVSEDVQLPLTLATAEFEYPEDPSIDSGVYYADVTMTFATL